MKDFSKTIEHAYDIAFTRFDQELVATLETTEYILSEYRDKLTPEQLCKVYLSIAVCKTKMDVPDDVLPMLYDAEKLAIADGNIRMLISCLNLQANQLRRTGHLQQAVQKLLNLLEIVPDPQTKTSILNNLGLVYTSFGVYDKALECLFESLRICEQTDNNKSYMRSCINVANCYYELTNYEKSVEYFLAAQKICEEFPNDESKISLTVNLALSYANLSDFDKALELLFQAKGVEKEFEYVKNKGSLIYNHGYIYELKGDYDEALKYYASSLEIVRTTRNILLLTTILNNKASVHIKRKEYPDAEALLLESLKITTDNNLPAQKKSCLKQLAYLYHNIGNYEKAFAYLHDFQTLEETLFNERVTNGIIKFESDYLTERIEQKAELYRLQYVELVEKNAIISQKQQQLEAALAQLSESNATKDKLFSIIAHDLRGPVANLQMTLQAILANQFSIQDADMMLKLLNEQTKNTFDLLENLLWWAQSQKEGLTLHPESSPLNPIADNIKSIYLTNAQNKHVNIALSFADDMYVYADKDALALILRNLIGNAIKYSPPNSTVTVSAFKADDNVKIEVADQGAGINPHILADIRKKKQIQSSPGTASENGTGLGLSLCFEFAHKMRGKLSVCKDYKDGTCFVLELPGK